MYKEQTHLTFNNTINLGSFYTPQHIMNIVFDLLNRNVEDIKDYFIVDTSCGYGSFLLPNELFNNDKIIGADIDAEALKFAKKNNPYAKYYCHNSLLKIDRTNYGLTEDDKVIIIGNPPYNDKTSIIRNEIKNIDFEIDKELKARDLGVSFMLSYQKLNADYVCVLHPLSYLIKENNFKNLRSFKCNYTLKDALVISSGEFSQTSKTTQFPIIIALYKKNDWGMNYNYISNYNFKTKEGKSFQISKMDGIGNYVTKYPNKQVVSIEDTVAYFWTMRDINALKRSKTFVNKESNHTIRVTKENLHYYQYVDIFKKYIPHIPYYFGNCDVFIDNTYFTENKNTFSNSKKEEIDTYFKCLLGEHYV